MKIKIAVDVAGFNYYEMYLDEVVEKYKLNPIQRQLLKQGEVIYLKDGWVTLSILD